MSDTIEKLRNAVQGLQASDPCDVLIYNGPIDRNGFVDVVKNHTEPSADTLVFVLSTMGGDPHAAYRLARVLGERYKKFTALIGAPCKSAGTLVVMGADEIVLSDLGELGPLDVQLRRADEPLEADSGLDLVTCLNHLTGSALIAWDGAFLEIQGTAEMSTKACADLAIGMVSELFGKLYAQIDPVRLGAVVRANSIATRYGNELGEYRKNLKPNAVQSLVLGYPSHGYAIDRTEAEKLFQRVRLPSPAELALLQAVDVAFPKVRRTEKDRVIARLDFLAKREETETGDSHDDKEKRPEPPGGASSTTADGDRHGASNGQGAASNQPGSSNSPPPK